jgi:predicted GIY-YIG superfamily endonuclease
MLRPMDFAWRGHLSWRAKHGARRSSQSEAGQKDQSNMYYVYRLHSESAPGQQDVGFTSDLKARLATHNRGGSPHTSKYVPWRLVTYLAFSTKSKALEFERYRKSHSGKAFAAKRLW